ncbi:MAG: hypothetical protein JKX94_04745 [Sneathiella sp.]|nr:hypothetical protein [Sneathiella sp.]
MIPNAITLNYDTRKYPFRKILSEQVFRVPRIDKLHHYWAAQSGKKKLDYGDNLLLRKIMQRLPVTSDFYHLYHRWLEEIIGPRYGNKISYTMHPKMRVHLSGTPSVSDFHNDASVTGRDDQINVYLPFTDVFDGSTLWCQKDYESTESIPLNLKYGQALIWDGGYLSHGTKENNTDVTRVSCDFRFAYLDESRVKGKYRNVLAGRPLAGQP